MGGQMKGLETKGGERAMVFTTMEWFWGWKNK
jgi:hypothetical protein